MNIPGLGDIEMNLECVTPQRHDEVHIAFTVDAKYVQHMGGAITSIIVNNPEVNFSFYIIYDNMLEADFNKLKKLSDIFQQPLHFYKITNPSQIDSLKIIPHISKAVYYRLMLPYILPQDLEKVIYLDADLVCCGDIRGLWHTPLGNAPVAAKLINAYEDQVTRLGISNGQYLNAGVLLVNLLTWRQDDIPRRIIDFMLTYPEKIVWLEQDAIAVVLEGQIIPIDDSFNTTIDCATGDGTIKENSVIIHFVGACKPWQQWCPDERKKLYWDYLKISPWREATPDAPQTLVHCLYAARLENARTNAVAVEEILRNLIMRLLN
ncbi:General stress protein A [bioreactor metagenome]|uniref:General stress protein A n=1 Tax=bioreactor metagenome TaxID=1076179 RepID=A0A644TN86_9ZZZZ|nr:glycosyltransferase family 8 protein [Negativicutes bacterium]